MGAFSAGDIKTLLNEKERYKAFYVGVEGFFLLHFYTFFFISPQMFEKHQGYRGLGV